MFELGSVESSWKQQDDDIVENGVRRRWWFGEPFGLDEPELIGDYKFAAKIELSPSAVWSAGPNLQGRTIMFIAATPLVFPNGPSAGLTLHEYGRFTKPDELSLGYTEMLAIPR
jgi:hypothetical protein